MTISVRPLSEVKMLLEELGTDVSFAYDDLVFIEHSAFLIQFDDVTPSNLKIFFNKDLAESDVLKIESKLIECGTKRKFTIINSGKFELTPKEDTEEIDIAFYPK